MKRFQRVAGLTSTAVAMAVLAGCHKKPEPAPEPVATPAFNADSARLAQEEAARRAAEDAARRRAADSAAAAQAEAARAATAAAAEMHTTLTSPVHFDYDQSTLRPDAQAALDAKIPILQANSDVMIRIDGNTDERGSDEYNLALGERRAAAAKQYLVQHGIADNRIETVSYGEERPVAQGSDESAWSQNRRDEFEITSGGQMLRRP